MTSNPLVSEKLRAGIVAKREGDYRRALALYNEAGRIDPTNIDVYGNSARVYAGLLDYDMCLRHVLTRQHLGQLQGAMSSATWRQMIDYFDVEHLQEVRTNSYLNVLLDQFTLFGQELLFNTGSIHSLVKEDGFRGDFIRYMVGDYQTTRIIGMAFLAQKENSPILEQMGVQRESIERVLEAYLGTTSTSTFTVYNPRFDPAVALFGLNVLLVNRSKNPIVGGSTEVREVIKGYLSSDFTPYWRTKP